MLLLYALTLLCILRGVRGALLLPSAADSGAVVRLVPRAEGRGVDLDDRGLGQGVCAHEFVVGRVVDDADDARLAADALAAPREAAGVEAKGAELAVAAAGADEVDALWADARVGGLAALLESSAGRRRWSVILRVRMAFRVMAHTASYGNVRVWHRSRRACGGNRVRYWKGWSAIISSTWRILQFTPCCTDRTST